MTEQIAWQIWPAEGRNPWCLTHRIAYILHRNFGFLTLSIPIQSLTPWNFRCTREDAPTVKAKLLTEVGRCHETCTSPLSSPVRGGRLIASLFHATSLGEVLPTSASDPDKTDESYLSVSIVFSLFLEMQVRLSIYLFETQVVSSCRKALINETQMWQWQGKT